MQEQRLNFTRRPSFAERTGQARGLLFSRMVSIAGGFGIFAGWALPRWPYQMQLILAGTVVGVAGFVWQCLSVRCPRCRAAVVWHTFKTRKWNEADQASVSLGTCPRCGFDPP
jgi:hypothetical protein